jgi:enoyl-CoA hydratase
VTVDRTRHGAVAIITLNRPEKRNALDRDAVEALGQALIDADADRGVRAIVLTGTGDRAFCAGMDLRAVGDERREPTAGSMRYQNLLSMPCPKPVIAAANATAVAGGFELLLACDMIVASERATFGIPEVKRGLVAGGGGTLLPLRIPMAVAMELVLTGEPITALRAHELGLVNRVVPYERVLEEAVALAELVAANSPRAVRISKKLLYDTRDMSATDCWDEIRSAVVEALASDDAREGARAFLERRAPSWNEH